MEKENAPLVADLVAQVAQLQEQIKEFERVRDEEKAEKELRDTRMKLLESALVKEKKKSAEATQQRKKRGRKEVVSESSGSSDSSLSSESDTESDKHASTKRRWKHASCEQQHSTNRLAMKALRKGQTRLCERGRGI